MKTTEVILSNGEKAGKTISELRKQLNLYTRDVNRAEEGSQEFIDSAQNLNKVRGKYRDLQEQIKSVGEEQGGLSELLQEYIPFAGQIGNVTGKVRGLTLGFKGLRAALIATGLGALLVLVGSIITYFTRFQSGIDFVSVTMAGLSSVVNEIIGRLGRFASGLWDIVNGRFDAGVDKLKGSFDNLSEGITSAYDAGKRIRELEIDLENFNLSNELAIARLNGLAERQSAIADDATRSFREREEAAEKARIAVERSAALELKSARDALNIVNEQVNLQRKQNGEVNRDLLQQQADAQRAIIEAENQLATTRLDNEKQRRELVQDRLERDLDILIDGFDNQKTINERLLQDDRTTFDERKKLLEETRDQANESFLNQQDVLNQLSSAQIDYNELLSLNAVELNKRIRALEQSEIVEGRTLEVIRERRLVLQDLADAERALAEEELEAKRADAEARLELLALEQERSKLLDEEFYLDGVITQQERDELELERQRAFREAELAIIEEFEGKESAAYKKALNEQLAADVAQKTRLRAAEEEFTELTNALKKEQEAAATDVFFNSARLIDQLIEDEKASVGIQAAIAISNIAIGLQEQLSALNIAQALAVKNLVSFGTPPGIAVARAAALFTPQKILAGVNAGISTASVIAAAAQKFEEGGVLRGPSHANGGIKAFVRGLGLAEFEGDEIVLNKNVSRDPAGLAAASALNVAFGGRSFETGGVLNPFSPSPDPSQGRGAGAGGVGPGINPGGDDVGFGDGGSNTEVRRLEELIMAVNARMDRLQVVNNALDTIAVSDEVRAVENEAKV
ncbi:MAG: hypothetical protein AAF363_14495 [Bacteroidota bacterium]